MVNVSVVVIQLLRPLFPTQWTAVWRRRWHPIPVLSSGESQGRGGLVGCSPRGREELDTTERLHFHFSLSCLGEGNGNPLQCSCLENPRDGGAWRVAVYGVAQSRTRLKRRRRSSRTAVCQVPLSNMCQSLLKFKSIESLHSLLPSSHFAFNLSQHQGIFTWVSSSHQVAKMLEL